MPNVDAAVMVMTRRDREERHDGDPSSVQQHEAVDREWHQHEVLQRRDERLPDPAAFERAVERVDVLSDEADVPHARHAEPSISGCWLKWCSM